MPVCASACGDCGRCWCVLLSADFPSDYVLRTYSNTDVLQTSNIRELRNDLEYNAGLLLSTVYGDPLFEVFMSCAKDSRF